MPAGEMIQYVIAQCLGAIAGTAVLALIMSGKASGWDGGLGTSWRVDPKEQMCGIVMTQRAWTSPVPPNVCADFWTSAYQAIDD